MVKKMVTSPHPTDLCSFQISIVIYYYSSSKTLKFLILLTVDGGFYVMFSGKDKQ